MSKLALKIDNLNVFNSEDVNEMKFQMENFGLESGINAFVGWNNDQKNVFVNVLSRNEKSFETKIKVSNFVLSSNPITIEREESEKINISSLMVGVISKEVINNPVEWYDQNSFYDSLKSELLKKFNSNDLRTSESNGFRKKMYFYKAYFRIFKKDFIEGKINDFIKKLDDLEKAYALKINARLIEPEDQLQQAHNQMEYAEMKFEKNRWDAEVRVDTKMQMKKLKDFIPEIKKNLKKAGEKSQLRREFISQLQSLENDFDKALERYITLYKIPSGKRHLPTRLQEIVNKADLDEKKNFELIIRDFERTERIEARKIARNEKIEEDLKEVKLAKNAKIAFFSKTLAEHEYAVSKKMVIIEALEKHTLSHERATAARALVELYMEIESKDIWIHKEIAKTLTNIKVNTVNIEDIFTPINELKSMKKIVITLSLMIELGIPVILFDVDSFGKSSEKILRLIRILKDMAKKRDVSLILLSNRVHEIVNIANTLFIFDDGRSVEYGNPMSIFRNPTHPLTKFLFRSYVVDAKEMLNGIKKAKESSTDVFSKVVDNHFVRGTEQEIKEWREVYG